MKRWFLIFAALALATVLACSGKTNESAGLQLIIATDMAVPGEIDEVRLEVRQQTAPGQWGAPFVKELRVPTDITLPTSFAITAGKGDNNAQIRLIGKKNRAPVVLSVVETIVPNDRVATLQIVLARTCTGQLVIDSSGNAQSSCPNTTEACQAETGKCGPVFADPTKLPEYRAGDEDSVVVPRSDAGTPVRDAASDAPSKSTAKEITKFTLLGMEGVISGSEINVVLPAGTLVTSLTPVIETTGLGVSPASGVAQNFSGPVTYTVTAADGSLRIYTVTVTVAPGSAKEIVQFQVLGINATVGASTIDVTVPFNTDRKGLIPFFSTTGASVSPVSGAGQDFTVPVEYTVRAADGTTKTYTVNVNLAPSPAKEISSFKIAGVEAVIVGTSITATVPSGTNVTSLVPTIVHVGASITPAAGTARDFTGPVKYTVAAADSTTRTYTVTVVIAGNGAKEITSFVINGVPATINGANISVTLPSGTPLDALAPTIGITGQSVLPASGSTQDFRVPVVYTVTAADASTKTFTVTASVAPSSSKDITAFSILGYGGVIVGSNITVTLPTGTSVTALAPIVSITGTNVTPASGAAMSFASPVTYVVRAADLTTKSYLVTVNVAGSSQKDITSFVINGVSAAIAGQNISLTLPFGTDVTNLTPLVQTNGVSVNPSSGVPRSFATAQTYTVTAGDASMKAYTVTVNVAPSSQKEITSFSIQGVLGVITGTRIVVTMPAGTIVTSLSPTIAISGQSVSPPSGTAQDFTSPVTYTVTAADLSTKPFLVTVSVAGSSQKDITSFVINGVNGMITGQNIALTLPFGTDVTNLAPTVQINGASVTPLSGAPRNFSMPQTYTVMAGDGSTKAYTVTVSVAPSSQKEITSFSIQGALGVITGTNIAVTMPAGTILTSLTPTIAISGQSVSPPSGMAQDFTNPVSYTVTAADNSTQTYLATVKVAGGSDKEITSFVINGVNGSIFSATGQILLTLPAGTDPRFLAPMITHSGVSINPASGEIRDFSVAQIYTVKAGDGTTKPFTVRVTVGGSSDKDITAFSINGLPGAIAGTSIQVSLPGSTNLSSLTPVIAITGVKVTPPSGVAQSFMGPVPYIVEAADGSTKTYTVTVILTGGSDCMPGMTRCATCPALDAGMNTCIERCSPTGSWVFDQMCPPAVACLDAPPRCAP